MTQYGVYLQATPTCCGSLLAGRSEKDQSELQERILARMKEEWHMVITMESSSTNAALLASWCPFTKHQWYREIHTALEASSYKVTDFVCSILRAWFPVISSSSLVEDVFAGMQDTVKRSTKRETASLTGLQASAIRNTMLKCHDTPEEGRIKGVELQSVDHEGLEVRGLRSGIWRPESAPNSLYLATVFPMCLYIPFFLQYAGAMWACMTQETHFDSMPIISKSCFERLCYAECCSQYAV